jgi:hypothetical protein
MLIGKLGSLYTVEKCVFSAHNRRAYILALGLVLTPLITISCYLYLYNIKSALSFLIIYYYV